MDKESVIDEPVVVYPEALFQNALVVLLHQLLKESGQQYVLLEQFGLDIAVITRSGIRTQTVFLEVKSFNKQRMGGVGFGNGNGIGPQVDLLLSADQCMPLLDSLVRWVYVDATRPVGSSRFSFFSCTEARALAMGGVGRNKQNNLSISSLSKNLVGWEGLRSQISSFVITNLLGQETGP